MNYEIDFSGASIHQENNRFSQNNLEENSEHFDKQCTLVYNLLKAGERLRVKESSIKYDIGHLPRRICDLRRHPTHPVDIKSKKIGRIVEYYIEK